MRGMKLPHGAVFVEQDGITLRYLKGKWSISPIGYDSLEWERSHEGRDAFDYLTESDIRGMGDECYKEMLALFASVKMILRK